MPQDRNVYWKHNLRLITKILIVWFLVSFGAGIIFVDFLDNFHLFGYPLGFWFAEQGSIMTFIVLIVIYTIRMNQLDKRFGKESNKEDKEDTV